MRGPDAQNGDTLEIVWGCEVGRSIKGRGLSKRGVSGGRVATFGERERESEVWVREYEG